MKLETKDIIELAKVRIAEEVVERLTPEEKKEILSRAVSRSFGEWSFLNAVEQVVKTEGIRHVTEYLAQPEVQEEIKQEAQKVASEFMQTFHKVMMITMLQMLDEGKTKVYEKPKVYRKMRDLLGITAEDN